ncbi:MAG TPA: hypothetical protein VGW10_17520, partial [Solirubrobacteraceae bacterium]|nr:hypothetical protein [Solirubrobacteraceae bacterium]
MAAALAAMAGIVPAAALAWTGEALPLGVYWAHDVASARPGEAVLLHRTIDGTFATVRPVGAEPEPTQQLDHGWNFYPTLDASPAGGAVAAWYNEDDVEIRVAERPPQGGAFALSVAVPGGRSDYSYGQPLVRVNERGDAIVVYLAETAGELQQVRALYRPAGGEFGAPEAVSTLAPWGTVVPRDVAVAPDGRAVVGFVQAGTAHVAVRPPGGPFAPAQSVGGTADEHSWQSPRVGIDAAGDVVVAWLEIGPADLTGPVRVAFRRAGEATFGAPRESGVRASDLGRLALGVSDAGELVLVVEAESSNPDGVSTHLEGLHVLMGNARAGRLSAPQRITDGWGSYPSLGMNARGDAVVAWDDCCPLAVRARRRAPLEGFGRIEDLRPPIEFEGTRGGIVVRTTDVDERGNARVTYEDFEEDRTYLATADPFVETDPPPVAALGDFVAPVLTDPPPSEGDVTPTADSGGGGSLPPPAPPPPVRPFAWPAAADRAAPRLSVRLGRTLSGGRR